MIPSERRQGTVFGNDRLRELIEFVRRYTGFDAHAQGLQCFSDDASRFAHRRDFILRFDNNHKSFFLSAAARHASQVESSLLQARVPAMTVSDRLRDANDGGRHLFDGLLAIQFAQETGPSVIINQRCGLAVIYIQTAAYRFRFVVLALT